MKITLSQQDKAPVVNGGVGLYLEDVNYALDGGLYAELLENRNFEAKEVEGDVFIDDGSYAWESYPAGADVALKIKTDRPLFYENPHYLRLTVNAAGSGIKNKAYDGIYLKAQTEYKISFYARSYNYKGSAFVGVYACGAPLMQKKVKLKPDGQWRRYAFRLKSKTDVARADFCFTLSKTGSVHLDCFSMTPANAVSGVFRRDLVTRLKELEPSYLRFPSDFGANGAGVRHSWKYTIGQTEHRRHNANVRGAAGGDAHYGQSFGIGFYEYFRLAEYLGAKPVPVVRMSCGNNPRADEETCLQDALDVIEFATGGADTVWGRVRTEMGHPNPFALEYLGVEFGACKTGGKSKCLTALRARLQEFYPKLKIVETGADTFALPEDILERADAFEIFPDGVRAGSYSAGDKNAEKTPKANTWLSALAEAAFATEAEKYTDKLMLSYAPLLARAGYAQRSPALVWFDGKSVCPTANYYVQQLFSRHSGDYALNVKTEEKHVFVSASERDAFTFVKVVNATSETLEAEVEGDYEFGALTQIICMQAELSDCNTFEETEKIVPKRIAPTGERTFTLPPHSFQALVFKK